MITVTRGGAHALPFLRHFEGVSARLGANLIIAADGERAERACAILTFYYKNCHILPVRSQGYIESVLDDVIDASNTGYILRMDDDEWIPESMVAWLAAREYETEEHWSFRRVHLWGDTRTAIVNDLLWPDQQTRLSIKAKARRASRAIHAPSPYGFGTWAPVHIEHHKFLVKTAAERAEIARTYERIQAGAGSGVFRRFSLPEQEFPSLKLVPYADRRGWAP